MEALQIEHIRKHLPELLRMTSCSAIFLSHFRADGLISEEEVDILCKIRNISEQSMSFYNIIQTRSKSFNLLKQALAETSQTGAFTILEKCPQAANDIKLQYHGAIGYNKLEVLGRGCFGTKVFLGKYGSRDVAVKKVSTDEIAAEISKEEVKFLKKLDWHENVVRLFEFWEGEDFILIALELCDTDLHNWVLKPKTLEIGEVEVIAQSARGIGHLHKNRVVHRDLKPANILMVRQATGDIRLKISDFGMAKKIPDGESRMSVHSSGVGTEGWMAPEVIVAQFQQERPSNSVLKMGFPSDIFSLGCIFYFVLTGGGHPFGEPLFRQTNVFYGKSELKKERITVAPATTSQGFIRLIRQMIAKEETERPQISKVIDCLAELDGPSRKGQQVNEPDMATPAQTTLNDLNLNDDIIPVPHTSIAPPPLGPSKPRKDDNPLNTWPAVASTSTITKVANDKKKAKKDSASKAEKALPDRKTELPSVTSKASTSQNTGINLQDKYGDTQLHKAAKQGNTALVKELVEKGANVNIENTYRQTPAHAAAYYCENHTTNSDKVISWNIIKYLISHKLDVFVQDSNNATFLHDLLKNTAAWNTCPELVIEIVDYLTKKGYFKLFSLKNCLSKTPFHFVVQIVELDDSVLSAFQKNGVDFNATDGNKDSILFYAVREGSSPEFLASLVKYGADVSHLNDDKQNLVHKAALRGALDGLKLFLKLGLDVNLADNRGNVPIHYAVKHVKEKSVCEFVAVLIEYDALTKVRNNDGNTPTDLISARKDISESIKEEVLNLLNSV